MKNLCMLAVGESSPIKIPLGAVTELFKKENWFYVSIPDLDEIERYALKKGKIKVGMVKKGSAILLVYQIYKTKKSKEAIFTFDTPLDARIIAPDQLNIPELKTENSRISITLLGIEQETNIIIALREITYSPEFSRKLIEAVKQQLKMSEDSNTGIDYFNKFQPAQIARMTKLYSMGDD